MKKAVLLTVAIFLVTSLCGAEKRRKPEDQNPEIEKKRLRGIMLQSTQQEKISKRELQELDKLNENGTTFPQRVRITQLTPNNSDEVTFQSMIIRNQKNLDTVRNLFDETVKEEKSKQTKIAQKLAKPYVKLDKKNNPNSPFFNPFEWVQGNLNPATQQMLEEEFEKIDFPLINPPPYDTKKKKK